MRTETNAFSICVEMFDKQTLTIKEFRCSFFSDAAIHKRMKIRLYFIDCLFVSYFVMGKFGCVYDLQFGLHKTIARRENRGEQKKKTGEAKKFNCKV